MTSFFEMDAQWCSQIFESLNKRFPENRICNVDEQLFKPGEDWFFYLVIQGSFSILRSPSIGEKKEIGRAYRGGFLGEWILFGNPIKEVEAIALEPNTIVTAISIDQMNQFRQEDPIMFSELLRSIAKVTNERLRLSNFELAMIYEANEKISALSRQKEGGMMAILDFLSHLFAANFATLIEHHEADESMLFSRSIISDQAKHTKITRVISRAPSLDLISYTDISLENCSLPRYGMVVPLYLGQHNKGTILLGKHTSDFSDVEKRVLTNVAPLLTSACTIEQQHQTQRDIERRKGTISPINTDNSYL